MNEENINNIKISIYIGNYTFEININQHHPNNIFIQKSVLQYI